MALPPDNPADKNKARLDAEQANLMREVDEAVRQDEAANFAKKYGWHIGGAVLLALAAFGGVLLWQNRSEGKLEQGSEQLTAALDELDAGNLAVADDELAAVASGDNEAAAAIAKMLRGGIALEQDKRDVAAGLFTEVADNADLPAEVRNIATIRLVSTQFDEMEPQAVIDRLGTLAVPGNPYFGSAGELVAHAYLEQNKPDKAGPLLVAISQDEDVPDSIRGRTRQLAGLLGFDPIKDVDDTLTELNGDAAAAGGAAAALTP